MLYNWAVEHPNCVGGIAGIYPVCNIASYPGLAKAAPIYELSEAELKSRLADHNPIERLGALAKASVPIHHIHGDQDRVVPIELNTDIVAKRYRELGGQIDVEVIKGRGHDLWEGWFQSEKLTEFVIENALRKE